MNGIFRDVYLMNRPANFIFDYFIQTQIKGDSAVVSIHTECVDDPLPVSADLFDPEGNKIVSVSFTDETLITLDHPSYYVKPKSIEFQGFLKAWHREYLEKQSQRRRISSHLMQNS